MRTQTTQYDQDFYAWTQEQAALLREGALGELDLTNLAEEIESLGKSDRRALGSHLRNLVLHLIKWHYQPSGRLTGQSWQSSIRNARAEIAVLLEDSLHVTARGRRPVGALVSAGTARCRRRNPLASRDLSRHVSLDP